MKRLVLLRHAKAMAKNAGRDFDRPLADRGRADLDAVARFLEHDGIQPDLALVSPSRRTRETWDGAGRRLLDVAVSHDARIYEASADELLTVLREADGVSADGAAECVVLVGHNPGISELAALLAEGETGAERFADGLPTATLAVFDVAAETWRDLRPGTARLVKVASPADLARAGV